MQTLTLPLPCAIIGTESTVTAFVYGNPHATRKIYIQASLHANELPGALAAWQLCQQLQTLEAQNALHAQIVVVPLCNPIGLRQNVLYDHKGRFDLATGQNFNRLQNLQFYKRTVAYLHKHSAQKLGQDAAHNTQIIRAAMHAVLAEYTPSTSVQALHKVLLGLAYDADVVLDLHCDRHAVMHMYTLPQLWKSLKPLACWLRSECQLISESSNAQSFDEVLSTPWLQLQAEFPQANIALACTSATIELRGRGDLSHQYAQHDADAIVQYLNHLGDVQLPAEHIQPMPSLIRQPHPLSGLIYIPASITGIVVYHVQAGDWVQAGDALADIIDPITQQFETVNSPIDGVVFATNNQHFVHPENNLLSLSGAENIGHTGLSP